MLFLGNEAPIGRLGQVQIILEVTLKSTPKFTLKATLKLALRTKPHSLFFLSIELINPNHHRLEI